MKVADKSRTRTQLWCSASVPFAGCLDTGSQVSVWKDTADSSGSEASKHDDDSIAIATANAAAAAAVDLRNFNNVHFSVGGEM